MLVDLVRELAEARVAVIGDVMLDRYVYGDVERISPEAPVPVLRVKNTRAMLGGAGNVAANVASLGAHVALIGLVGQDEAGTIVRQLAADLPNSTINLISQNDCPTVVKTRII